MINNCIGRGGSWNWNDNKQMEKHLDPPLIPRILGVGMHLVDHWDKAGAAPSSAEVSSRKKPNPGKRKRKIPGFLWIFPGISWMEHPQRRIPGFRQSTSMTADSSSFPPGIPAPPPGYPWDFTCPFQENSRSRWISSRWDENGIRWRICPRTFPEFFSPPIPDKIQVLGAPSAATDTREFPWNCP